MASTQMESSGDPQSTKYTVVARRYRPKTFEELVGQDTAAQALLRAIETHRVGHAYLFTGARGVGKTSTARIFAKALNASPEGNGRFDPNSEIALAIDSGEDMDVIEIDGASNRGIDEIRALRQNALVRPSRSPFKIYIIDEVHMLTTAAFNALLKTLEEPPGHVKFIFCTTDPEKIPITVLSRCQRFDFPPVHTDQILQRLQFICQNEGTEAELDALKLIARRAAGSMRDSQSLLEQLLSFGGKKISVGDVHAMLGTADESRLANFAQCMIERNAAGAIHELDTAVHDGVDAGQLAEQFLGYLRDIMALKVGASADIIRTANMANLEQLRTFGQAWGLTTLLSAIQIVDETIVKMKHSVQSRILLEVALVQICSLVDLQALADVVQGISRNLVPNAAMPAGQVAIRTVSSSAAEVQSAVSKPVAVNPAPVTESVEDSKKKESSPLVESLPSEVREEKSDVRPQSEAQHSQGDSSTKLEQATSGLATSAPTEGEDQEVAQANPGTGQEVAGQDVAGRETAAGSPKDMLAQAALQLGGLMRQLGALALEVHERVPGAWQVRLAKEAAMAMQQLRKPDTMQRLRGALQAQTGSEIQLDFVLTDVPMPNVPGAPLPGEPSATASAGPSVPQAQRIREAMAKPLVKRFMDLFEGEVLRVEASAPRVALPTSTVEIPNADGLPTGDEQE
jgi:DNA polymerase-3 subunit gamma/tau